MLLATATLVVLAAHVALVDVARASPIRSELDTLCQSKNFDLTTLPQLRLLDELAREQEKSSCPDLVKRAIADLLSLIEQTRADLCSTESIEQLRTYYANYLDSSKTAIEQHAKLPKPLRRLAIAYGMQMSNRCKRNMVRVLTDEDRHLLASEHFEMLAQLLSDGGPVADVLGAMGDKPDEVFLPGDLAPFLKKAGIEQKSLGDEKIFMQSATAPYIQHIQQVCARKFKPIYDPLMMPLVRLSNMGFNYKDEPLKCSLKCPATVREVGQWSRLVFLCESLASIHLIEDKQAGESGLTAGTDTKLVRILTRAEAEAIGGGGAQLADEDDELTSEVDAPGGEFQHEKVTFEGDLIYDKADKRLGKSIKKFKTSRNEEETIRKRLMQRGMALARSQIKKGKIGVIISATYKGVLAKTKGGAVAPVASPSEQMVRTLNEMIEQQQQGGGSSEGAVAHTSDRELLMYAAMGVVGLAVLAFLLYSLIGGAVFG